MIGELSRFAKTKRLATEALEKALAERHNTGVEMTSSTRLTEAGQLWLTQIKRTDSRLSAKTIEAYEGGFFRYVDVEGSTIRGLTLTQLNDPQRLKKFLQAVADQHGTASAKMAKSIVSGILRLAIENGVLARNALREIRPVSAQVVNPTTRERDTTRALTREERDSLIAHADKLALSETISPSTRRKRQTVADLLAFMAGTGVRINEARSLRWEDVDLETGAVNVNGLGVCGLQLVHLQDHGKVTTFAAPSFGSSEGPNASSLDVPPLFAALNGARSVLLAGAGGGFDVYAALPLAITLWDHGVAVHLANLSFTQLELLDLDAWSAPNVALVGPATNGPEDYFPERTLARWLAGHNLPSTVYAFAKTGVQPLRAAYQHLVGELGVDAIVLIDGGTDILLRGDEAGLGTPTEDITSLAAVAGMDVSVKLVSCLGFGIDAYHGVVHSQVLENLAALDRDGGYLGALSIPGASRAAVLYRDAVADAQQATPMRPSIVHGQIAAATTGAFGDVQFTRRTAGSTLFVNPLMAAYFTVDLAKLADRCLYLDRIEQTFGMRQVATRIETFREGINTRTPRVFPH
ncbi:DUF1152 domain-containing protein [Actinoplanes sp. NEAU-A12]|uniref:DUF1152 domain-containing protein n=1 Tax=Actinoplanes sandaracinus TaxID=3045177 RepID=A0ABT6WZG1_9ACTN|nr:DUF1152 domain-containing protein [Actinoplanes sandaracinus]MDI6105132.1 DUF1152 domain-containing protein [Actinoplanes sandaracinus]